VECTSTASSRMKDKGRFGLPAAPRLRATVGLGKIAQDPPPNLGWPSYPQGTGFPRFRPLPLAVPRSSYLNPLPHGKYPSSRQWLIYIPPAVTLCLFLNRSHVTTDVQSVSQSVSQCVLVSIPMWDSPSAICYCLTFAVLVCGVKCLSWFVVSNA
jgi:hypothetical protein